MCIRDRAHTALVHTTGNFRAVCHLWLQEDVYKRQELHKNRPAHWVQTDIIRAPVPVDVYKRQEYDLPAIDERLRGNYLLYGPRLYERKHPPRQYTPKRYRPKDSYAGKGVLEIFLGVFFGE